MAKWFGVIGFAETVETKPGVWEEKIIEREYYGDLIKHGRRLQSADKINDDITISNEISVVSDPYSVEHIYEMHYLTFMGSKWKISNVDVQIPRLILTLGGLYI